MKQALKLIGLIALTLILCSCSKSKDEMDIIGKSDDTIKLSTKTVHFNKNKNTTTITTIGKWWWINAVSVNEKYFIPHKILMAPRTVIYLRKIVLL